MSCTAWHEPQIPGPALSPGCVKPSVVFTSACTAPWRTALLRKACWHGTSRLKTPLSCQLQRSPQQGSREGRLLFAALWAESTSAPAQLCSCCRAGCGKILLMGKPLSCVEDQNNEPNSREKRSQQPSCTLQTHPKVTELGCCGGEETFLPAHPFLLINKAH